MATRRFKSLASFLQDLQTVLRSSSTKSKVDTAEIKRNIRSLARYTKNGVTADDEKRAEIALLIASLEESNPINKLTTSDLIDGDWTLLYTTNDGSSAGKLGPFVGNVFQEGRLSATWDVESSTLWTVKFQTLILSLFGVPLKTQDLSAVGTWRMTYLDNDFRILYAQGGKNVKKENVYILANSVSSAPRVDDESLRTTSLKSWHQFLGVLKPSGMSYIDQWLTGLGLEYVIPKLKEHGITTPKKLATLSLREMYEVVGVEDAEDRKKLYYLIQRLQSILKKEASKKEGSGPAQRDVSKGQVASSSEPRGRDKSSAGPETSPEETGADAKMTSSVDALTKGVNNMKVSPLRRRKEGDGDDGVNVVASSMDGSIKSDASEEDLSVLRRRRRETMGSALTSKGKEDESSAAATRPSRTSLAGDASTGRRGTVPVPVPGPVADAKSAPLMDDVKATAPRRLSTQGKVPVPGPVVAPKDHMDMNVASPDSLSEESEKRVIRADRARERQRDAPASRRRNTSATSAGSRRQSSAASSWSVKNARDPSPIEKVSSHRGVAGNRRHSSYADVRRSRDKDHDDNDDEGYPQPHPHGRQRSNSATTDDREAALQRLRDKQNEMRRQREMAALRDEEVPEGPVEDMAIRVVVRKRPISAMELRKGDYDVMEVVRRQVLLHQPMTKVDLTKVIETQSFTFDDSFDDTSTNESVYARTIKPLVASVFEGCKASCFAYGQTGSGKTHTMMGANPGDPNSVTKNAGLYVLAARDVFSLLDTTYSGRELEVLVSCFEIYGGKLFDLLNERKPVKCLEDGHGRVQIRGIAEHKIESTEALLELMRQAHDMRSTGSTGANEESSRSHQVLQITVGEPAPATARNRFGAPVKAAPRGMKGKLSFIDLAGSERGADTTNNSKQTRMEGAEINTSLLALKEVIRSRERKQGHTPFRGSKLTQVLKDSFVGDNTRTCMIACVSPSHSNCEHTLNTLRYADRVKEHESRGHEGGSPQESAPPQQPQQQQQQHHHQQGSDDAASRRPRTASSQVQRRRSRSGSRSPSPASRRPNTAPTALAGASDTPAVAPVAATDAHSSQSQSPAEAAAAAAMSLAPSPLETVDEKGESGSVSLGSTGLIQRTFNLLSAHKLAIAEMVEVMKDEMELVQCMESADERDSESYLKKLEKLLRMKKGAVLTLQEELHSFQKYRKS